MGSWIWRKIIKYRTVAKDFCKVKVENGQQTSFWFDNWSQLGRLVDITGIRGVIDMGIGRSMSVAEAWSSRRRRRHRRDVLNSIEDALWSQYQCKSEKSDLVLWRGKNDEFIETFSTRDTWNHIRTSSQQVAWHKGVWFPHATPKYSFCCWLAVQDRLATGARMARWNHGVAGTCLFCQQCLETREHLFFHCTYTAEIWAMLAKGVFKARYTTVWHEILDYISSHQLDRIESFLVRYIFQVTTHTIWQERNGRRHGEPLRSASQLIKWIDQQVRNQFITIQRLGDRRYDKGLQLWFQSRI